MANQCVNLALDRRLGAYWERMFCVLAADWGRTFTPMQIGRTQSAQAYAKANGKWHHHTLPDVTVWTAPGEHHEIKHKSPTRGGKIGLEQYRLDALKWFRDETQQSVYYTIHRHDLNGGRDNQHNNIEHWFTVNLDQLLQAKQQGKTQTYPGTSWCNGKRTADVPIVYWCVELWVPLASMWGSVYSHN